jgi:hypothetical protein
MLARIPNGDVLGRSSFQARLSDIDAELAKIDERLETGGSVALMFGGAPVTGSRAIDAEFATKVLDDFQSLVSTRIALNELGSLGGRGPLPTRSDSTLAITELVRGSVGFLLEENTPNTQLADSAVKFAIDDVTKLVEKTATESDADFEQAVETLDSRLVVSLRNFFQTLDKHGATIRIVEDEHDAMLDATAIHRGRERMDATEIEDTESEQIVGELLGLLPDSRRFEMRLLGTDEIIKGPVAAAFAAKYLELIEGPHGDLSGRKWRMKMKIREIRERNKPPRKLYTLIGLLEPLDGQQPA